MFSCCHTLEFHFLMVRRPTRSTPTDTLIPYTSLVRSYGRSITTAQGGTNTAKFAIGEFCDVFDEDDRKVTPGSGVPGFIALMGAIPAGYYKDPEKSAKTFRTIDGVRYSIPGDW